MHKTDVNTEVSKKQITAIQNNGSSSIPVPRVHARIDVIALFGSQKLMRDGDTGAWKVISGTTKPRRLTLRESMFINAALHAAGVQ